MNERIRELDEQAGFQSSDVFGVMANSNPIQENIEKFTELIVRECIDIVPWQYEEKIKLHFGVEE